MSKQINLDPTASIIDCDIDGESVKIRIWQPEGKARAIAVLVHGLGAHSAWFEAFARCMQNRGILLAAYDQRGFGTRMNSSFESYKQWGDDLVAVSAFLRKRYELELFLMGNSMGALVVMLAHERVQADGLAIFSPGFDGNPKSFSLAYKIKSVVSAIFNPLKEIELPYNLELVSREESVRQWLQADSMKRLAVPGYMLLELLKLTLALKPALQNPRSPVLMLTAGNEHIVNNELNLKVFAGLNAPAKRHICFAEAWHDLMFDPLVDDVSEAVAAWQNELLLKPAELAARN